MFFIHGGGNTIGDATVYDAARLAAENGVVVVTVQYRLGVFGWFAHRALRERAEGPEDASGNFATLDLVRALEWTRDHIAPFGGDPERVTIFGESAGAVNVFSLLLSPRAEGLFHGAIAQSGFVTGFSLEEAENPVDHATAPGAPGSATEVLLRLLVQDGRAADRAAAKDVLAGMDGDAIRTYLYDKEAGQILQSFLGNGGGMGGMYFSPFVFRDGHVVAAQPGLEAFAAGAYHRVPTILGTNRDENRLFLAFTSPHVTRLASLPVRINDPNRYRVAAEYGSNLWKASGVDAPAFAMRRHQEDVWGYRFDWDEEPSWLWLDLAELLGAAHALELLFVFGGTNTALADRLLLEDVASAEELSGQMRSYWAEFAHRGDPGRGQDRDLPEWPTWAAEADATSPRFLVFDSARDRGLHVGDQTYTVDDIVGSVPHDPRLETDADRCEIYAGFVMWSEAMTPEEYETVGDGICRAHPLPARTAAG